MSEPRGAKGPSPAATGPAAATGRSARRPGRGQGAAGTLGQGASAEARRQVAAILEVLAGLRSPAEAAQALATSLPRYDVLETRALQGMLAACEPRPRGRSPTAEGALAALRRECEPLRRECARQQALVRAAQRTVGLAPPAPAVTKPAKGSRKRRRRPAVRALRAAAQLQAEESAAPAAQAAGPTGG